MYASQPRGWNPALVFAVALAGGVLLNYYLNRPMQKRRMASRASRVRSSQPSARLGAREDQVDQTIQHLLPRTSEEGVTSPTGAAYDFDPHSITPG